MGRSNLVVVFFIVFLIFACKKEKTQWSTSWSTPLFSDTLGFASLMDSGHVSVQSDNSLRLTLDQNILNLDLFEYLNIPDTSVIQSYTLPFQNLYVSPGASFVDDVEEFEFDLGDIQLTEVIIESGFAKVTIENPITEPAIFTIKLPGVTQNGVVFSRSKIIPAAQNGIPGVDQIVFDFSDYKLDLSGENSNSFNKLQSSMKVSTAADGNGVNVTQGDVFKFDLAISELNLKYAKGYFGNQVFTDTVSYDVNEFNNIVQGTIDLENVDLSIKISNGVNVNAQLLVSEITSENMNTNFVGIQHPLINVSQSVSAAQSSFSTTSPSEAFFNFTSTNSNIENFIENLGYSYSIGYALELNPWGNTSGGNDEIFPGSKLELSLLTDMPLTLGVQDLMYRDTFEFDVEQDFNGNYIESGSIYINTKNSFPFSGKFLIHILDANKNLIETVESTQKIEAAYSSVVSSISNFPEIENQLKYSLNEKAVEGLNRASYLSIEFVLDADSNDQQVIYDKSKLVFDVLTDFNLTHAL